MKTKRRTRKFADGGFSTAEGENKNISDDVRARALRSVMPDDSPAGTTGYGEQNDLPETKTVTKTTVSKTPAKPKGESAGEYKTRMESLVEKQALKRVEPENYIPGTGLLKNLLKRGLKTIGAAKQLENNPTKRIGLDKSMYKSPVEKAREARANARKSKMKQENYDAGPAGRARSSGAMVDDLTPGSTDLLSRELRPDFKRGGSVKSSASRRADGCAIRGKTRA